MIEDNSKIIDEYGNLFTLKKELSRGGQGVVYRTDDPDLAIKIPLNDGNPDKDPFLNYKFNNIVLLPLPNKIPITLPVSILNKEQPGYVMKLLNNMKPLKDFSFYGEKIKEYEKKRIPEWLSKVNEIDHKSALNLFYYSQTGSTRLRLKALFKAAAILARLHLSGIIFGDVSPNNIFFLPSDDYKVWLIDSDNLRFDLKSGGSLAFTPGLGAPEIMKGEDGSHPYTDSWAFAVMAFQMLSLNHPFEGKALTESDDDWDSDNKNSETFKNAMDSQGYAIYYPYIDDEDDDSNNTEGGLPRELILTDELKELFQLEFGIGRLNPLARPCMSIWAIALAKAHDNSIVCPECKMSDYENLQNCPYCDGKKPAYYKITTQNWSYILQPEEKDSYTLPHRLFFPFSFEHSDEIWFKDSNDSIFKCQVLINKEKHRLELDYGCKFPIDENSINIEYIGGRE